MTDKVMCVLRAVAPIVCIICALYCAYHEDLCLTLTYIGAGIILALADIAYILIDGWCSFLDLITMALDGEQDGE